MSVLVRGARLVDPDSEDEAEFADLYLEGDEIADVGLGLGDADATIDADGLFALPGLVDSHVHLCFDPNTHPESSLPGLTDDQLLDQVVVHGEQTVRAGVTTVRDLGSRAGVLRRYSALVASGAVTGPRVFRSGPVLTVPRGHCFYVGEELDPVEPALLASVRRHADAGDDWLKVMVTGGAMTSSSRPEELQFGSDALRAVVRAARVPVAAHVLTGEGGDVAVAAGVSTIEHGVGITDSALEGMMSAGMYLTPVLSASHRLLSEQGDTDSEHVRRLRAVVGVLWDSAKRAISRDVQVLAGTDAGCPAVPHGSVATEVELLVRAGLSPRCALAAATTSAAGLLGLAHRGRLRRGGSADLVLVAADPRQDVGVLHSPAVVISRGKCPDAP